MKKSRQVTLKDKYPLSKNLWRLVFTGESLADFPLDQESGYIKLLFSNETGLEIDQQKLDDKPYFKQLIKRTFTIRKFDADNLELHIDGVGHSFDQDDQGPANTWLQKSQAGDQIWITGPGSKKLIHTPADWYFFAGDMTALPAIAVNLEQLPEDAQGYAVLEVMDMTDMQPLKRPPNFTVHWVINSQPKIANDMLATEVRELPWLDGTPSVWVAGEFEMMRNLRGYFKHEQQVPKQNVYASSYWKIGEPDEGNKAAKRLDEQLDRDI